jgi:hypothetical protein
MSESVLNTLIVALLSAGGATFIWTVVRSVIAYRNSAEGREDKAIARLEKFEENCRDQLARERTWGAYWQRRTATMEHAILAHVCKVDGTSLELPPFEEPPEPQSPSLA